MGPLGQGLAGGVGAGWFPILINMWDQDLCLNGSESIQNLILGKRCRGAIGSGQLLQAII